MTQNGTFYLCGLDEAGRGLFYDTGVGKSAYSIMEQGKIDQILSSKAEERRYIFEEAAGITKFKFRSQEAEKKLEKTEENLRQIEGIITEVRRSYDTLKVQADKTQHFRTLRKGIFDLEKNLQLVKLKSLKDQKAGVEKDLAGALQIRNQKKLEIDTLNQSMESNLDLVSSLENQLVEVQKKIFGLELENSSLDSQVQMLGERASQIRQQGAASEARGQALLEKIQNLAEARAKKLTDLEAMDLQIKSLEQNIQSFGAQIHQGRERIQENKNQILHQEGRISQFESQRADILIRLRQVTDTLVEELDQGLKQNKTDWSLVESLETSILSSGENLRVLLQGKVRLLADRNLPEKVSSEDWKAFGLTLQEDLARGSQMLDQMLTAYQEQRDLLPRFLKDFLSPEGIITQKHDLEAQIEHLDLQITQTRQAIQALTGENLALEEKMEGYRRNLEDLKINQATLTAQETSAQEEIRRLGREEGEERGNWEENQRDREENQRRLQGIQENLLSLEEKKKSLKITSEALQNQVDQWDGEIKLKNQSLAGKEHELKALLDAQAQSQAKIEEFQMLLAQLDADIRNVFDNFRDKHSVELQDHLTDEIPESSQKDFREALVEKKEELRALGQVNLMAPEEFAEVSQRYEFLNGQFNDLKKAREDLHQVTREIRTESSQLFLQTFEEIKKNFNLIFRRLFGGGRGELKLSDPEKVLESGIEMFCQPPGKKLENINLLSGGERSMTAVALLFATFMVKPSPFCILDEIDAALDESNVGRFVNMLLEFGAHSQFIVITHNKKTVTGANTLIGVTMEESGVSKIITIRLQDGTKTEELTHG